MPDSQNHTLTITLKSPEKLIEGGVKEAIRAYVAYLDEILVGLEIAEHLDPEVVNTKAIITVSNDYRLPLKKWLEANP